MQLTNFIQKKSKLIKFLIVWVSSTIIDIVSLYILVDFLNVAIFTWVIISFLLAVINGFLLNKNWTFRNKSIKYKRQFAKFLIVSFIWLLITLFLMYIFVELLWIYYIISKVLTSLFVVIWNFLWNKYWTFNIGNLNSLDNNDYKFEYSIIIPAYNEEFRIIDTLMKINDFFSKKEQSYEIIVVDDWSKDNTIKKVNDLNLNIKIFKNDKNRWKWYSVKNGILSSNWKYILFTDADNSTPIEEFDNLFRYLDEYDIVIWSRYLDNSKLIIKQPLYRIIIWRLWNKIINFFLINWIKDTQCWFKLFKSDVAKKIFRLQKINWFGFDMEILLAWKSMWYKIKEVQVLWINSSNSRIRPIKDTLKTFMELIFIKVNYWFDWYK